MKNQPPQKLYSWLKLSVLGLAISGLTVPIIGAAAESAGVAAYYNVRSYGATGDGQTLDSPAINKAIEACAEAGGGTVYLSAGTYLSGSIRLKSNIHLLIDMGATILGAPQNMKAYDEEEHFEGPAFQDGGHTYFHNSLIWGEGLTNIAITGQGMIQGSQRLVVTNAEGRVRTNEVGLVRNDGVEDRMSGFVNFGKTNITARTPGTNSWPQRLGNKAIALKLCRNIVMRDFTLFRGGHFAILVTGCDNLTVDNVTMDTDRDGIDIDCCRNTVVSNCRINSPADDGLCPKSSFALGRNVITENLTIVNCQVSGFEVGTLLDGTMKPRRNGTGRIKFGTEANGGFRNVTVANCTFRNCRGLALEEVDGGILENITINNITMMDVQSYPIYVTTGRRNRGPNVTVPSRMKNILISNIIATGIDPMRGVIITGLPDQPIEGLRLENIRLEFKGGGTKEQAESVPRELGTGYPEPGGTTPGYGLFARHVKDLELANFTVSYEKEDVRPAMVCVDVDGLEIDNFKAQLPTKVVNRTVYRNGLRKQESVVQLADGITAARFEEVKRLVVRNSPVLDGVRVQDAKPEAPGGDK